MVQKVGIEQKWGYKKSEEWYKKSEEWYKKSEEWYKKSELGEKTRMDTGFQRSKYIKYIKYIKIITK